jgi:glycosyltransferase involved in cell wall biosynthesis
MADWGLPSERFVVDLVRTTARTHPSVVCGRAAHGFTVFGSAPISVTSLAPVVSRLPYRLRRPATRGLIAGVALRQRSRLLHAHFGYWAAHAAAVAERLHRPWIVSLHGYDVLVGSASDHEMDHVHRANAVIVPSRFLANAAIARGYPAAVVHVIPSGIDVDRYPFRPREPRADGAVRITFGGRFVEKKGVLDAAEALAAAAQRTALVCRFVGYGPLDGELRAAVERLRLAAEIVDGSSPGALGQVLDDTDILLTPSKTAADGDAESLGLVNIEAQACGIPVISTAHGGIPEALTTDGAILVPEGDVAALTESVVSLATSPQRWAPMGRAGSADVRRRFRLSDRVREVEDLYLAIIDNSAQRRRSHP